MTQRNKERRQNVNMEQNLNDVKRDETMDLRQLKDSIDVDTSGGDIEASPLVGLIHQSNNDNDVKMEEAPIEEKEPEEHLTELQKAMRAKQNGGGGMEVDPALQVEEPRVLRNIHDTDENRQAFTDTFAEQEEMIAKAKKVVLFNRPENEIQRAQMMDELTATIIDQNGNAIVPPDAKYLMARTPEVEEQIRRIKEKEAAGESTDGELRYDDLDVFVKQANKDKIVKILIDKTGLGVNITFDDEEKKVIEESNIIHLIEVEDQELQTVPFEYADTTKPFIQTIDTYQLSVSKAPMTFPASGFKADVTGMSIGELIDVTLDVSDESDDYLNFEKINRRLSVIYNKLINISIGKFQSYEDFLKKFAYVDVEPAIYGLLIATEPEMDEIQLKCNGKDCEKRFTHKYSTRSLIDFKSANTYYLKRIDEINSIPPEDRLKYAINSPVRKGKRIKLPQSGYIVDLIMINCYNYLYGLLPYINELSAQGEENPDNEKKWAIVPMLNVVGAISIKQRNGQTVRFTDMSQIVDILTGTLPPSDMKILQSVYKRYLAQFYVGYSIKNVRCPHCGRVTEAISLTPDELVFQITQRQEDTLMMFDNFQDF